MNQIVKNYSILFLIQLISSSINLLGLGKIEENCIKVLLIVILTIVGVLSKHLVLESKYLKFKPYWFNIMIIFNLILILSIIGAIFNIISQHN